MNTRVQPKREVKNKPAENRLFLSDVYGCSEYGENEQPRKMSPDGNFLRGLS